MLHCKIKHLAGPRGPGGPRRTRIPGRGTPDNPRSDMRSIIRMAGAVALCLAGGGALAQNISIATGGTGGVYYPMGGGLGAVLSKAIPGVNATAEVTGGSVANLQLIGTGKPYIAFTQADAAIDAVKGEDKFAGKPIPVRTLAVLYPNRMHVVTMEGTGIAK